MTKIDNWLIEYFQWGYDYLWDRWGIYVGQVMQFLVVLIFGLHIIFVGSSILEAILIIILVAILEPRNIVQKNGMFEVINTYALSTREDRKMRAIVSILWFCFELLTGWSGFITAVLWISYGYLFCVLLRNRDESRFKQHKLAYQEN